MLILIEVRYCRDLNYPYGTSTRRWVLVQKRLRLIKGEIIAGI